MFCKTVWNSVHILPDGYIRMCSLGQCTDPALDKQRARDKDGNVMHILTHSLEDIMNSNVHREVRKLNMTEPSAWSPHCECCENREILSGPTPQNNPSRRIYLMQIDSETGKADKEGNVDWMPASLDIRFGNLCNQKCIMCSPSFSSLWYEEWFDYYEKPTFGQANVVQIVKDPSTNRWISPPELKWYENPLWWEKFEQVAPHLRHIYITGGEPMVVPAHDEMLDRLIASGHAQNIWLEYDTNCSVVNDRIAERWSHFKKVHVRGSMDGIMNQYELIRFPGKWSKFQQNVLKLQEYERQSNGRIKIIALTACFQLTTAFSIIESEEWCKSIGVNYHIRFLEGPEHHAVASLPDSAKQKLIDYYEPHVHTNSKAAMIINHLKLHSGEQFHKPESIKEFVRFMDYLDSTRSTNWRQTFPQLADLIHENPL